MFILFSRLDVCAFDTSKLENIFYVHSYIKTISKLFGPNISIPPTLVLVEIKDENVFFQWLDHLRPINRKLSQPTNLRIKYGLLYPDAAALQFQNSIANSILTLPSYKSNIFSIEIKPKQGWNINELPDTLLNQCGISTSKKSIQKCRFCSMQYLKVRNGT